MIFQELGNECREDVLVIEITSLVVKRRLEKVERFYVIIIVVVDDGEF